MELVKIDDRFKVKEVTIKVFDNYKDLIITLENKNEIKRIKLTGSNSLYSIGEIIDCKWIEIIEDEESQLEFGKIKLRFSSEAYFEIYFDKYDFI